MMNENPYSPPHLSGDEPDQPSQAPAGRRTARILGTAQLWIGLVVSAYGAVAFWGVPSLPPNGGASGRLPSLYLIIAGIVIALVGMVVRDARWLRTVPQKDTPRQQEIQSAIGILILLAMVIALFLFIAFVL